MPITTTETSSAVTNAQLASTLEHHRRTLRDNVSDQTPLLSFLMGGLGGQAREAAGLPSDGLPGVIVGGNDISVPVQLAENTSVGSYSGADTIDLTLQDNERRALFPIRGTAGSVVMLGRERRANQGEAVIFSLLEGRVKNLEDTLRMRLNEQAVSDGTGNNGKDLVGLAAIIGTGLLAGLDPATWVRWQPGGYAAAHARHGIDSSGINLDVNLATVAEIYNNVSHGQDMPDFLFSTKAIAEDYEFAALTGNIRYTDLAVGAVGFRAIMFKGANWLWDHDVPSQTIYVLNSRHIAFMRTSGGDFEWLDEGQRPIDQDAFVRVMIVEGNIVTDNRRLLGALTGVT